jgi:heme A synthase
MWKLIKYELQARYFGLLVFLLGILGWDIAWIFNLNKDGFSESGLTFSLISFAFLTIFLFGFQLIVNTNYFYRYFQTNNLSHLQGYPIHSNKTLLSKLIVVALEFLGLNAVHFVVMVSYYGIAYTNMKLDPNTYSIESFASVLKYSQNLLATFYQILMLYLLSILILFLAIILIRRAVQNSKAYFWITFFLISFYFYTLVNVIAKLTKNSSMDDTMTNFSYNLSYPWWIVVITFLVISSLLSVLINWFYTRKTDF